MSPPRRCAILRSYAPRAVWLWRRESAAIRKAAATRVLALFRFFFLTGLPPLLRTLGAKVTWETNCFSVGKRLKSEPYSLTTTFYRFHSDGIDLGDINTTHSV